MVWAIEQPLPSAVASIVSKIILRLDPRQKPRKNQRNQLKTTACLFCCSNPAHTSKFTLRSKRQYNPMWICKKMDRMILDYQKTPLPVGRQAYTQEPGEAVPEPAAIHFHISSIRANSAAILNRRCSSSSPSMSIFINVSWASMAAP